MRWQQLVWESDLPVKLDILGFSFIFFYERAGHRHPFPYDQSLIRDRTLCRRTG